VVAPSFSNTASTIGRLRLLDLKSGPVRGVRQYVIVGAGLDTFPWRQPAFAKSLRIFYVDHPATLAWSTARLRERGLQAPPNLSFVAVDLENLKLPERLYACGFERNVATFCSVLGVVQCIGQAAIDALFSFAAALPAHSEIVLSFALPEEELEGEDRAAAIHGVVLTQALGEPWITRLRMAAIFDQLTRLGFGEMFHLTPKRAQPRYFANCRDGLRAPNFEQLIAAVV